MLLPQTPAPHVRTRRRERPGARTRRALSQKASLAKDISEGLSLAYSPVHIPGGPSQAQYSQRAWEEQQYIQYQYRIMLERERRDKEDEERRVFGGEVNGKAEDGSLVDGMLGVVHFLFDGAIDYDD